jgi:hypothetical protein
MQENLAPATPVVYLGRPLSNRSFGADTQRHCAASRAREHTSRGALPVRAGQLRR